MTRDTMGWSIFAIVVFVFEYEAVTRRETID